MTIIRPAKIKDLPEIAKLRVQSGFYHSKLDNILKTTKNPDYFIKLYKGYIYSGKKKLLVAETNGKIVGFGSASISIKSPTFKIKNYGHISDIYVSEKSRRIGVAGKILEGFYKWYRENNIRYLELNVMANNKLGRCAWDKYGFKDFLIRKRKILK